MVSRPMGIRLGSLAGVEIRADWSLAIIFFLVLFSLGAGVFPSWHPDWGGAAIWLTAAAAALLFFASVLIHELAHAVVGRLKGIEIRRIVLFVFGGMAQLEREPHSWRAELAMAIVGPIASFALGVLFLLLGSLAADARAVDPADPLAALSTLGPVATVLLWLAPVNFLLALFNLVPGFPLDGGRVLRAALWGATGDLYRATRWASQAGQGFAWLLIACGFGMMLGLHVPVLGTGLLAGMWIALIGWFLNNAAAASYRQLLARRSLESVPVSRLMLPDVATVPSDISVATLVDDYIMASDQRAFPVLEGGKLAGLVCLDDARRVPAAERGATPVRSIMTPASELETVTPEEAGAEALDALARRSVSQLPVVKDGEVRGLLRREDLIKWLTLRGEQARAPA